MNCRLSSLLILLLHIQGSLNVDKNPIKCDEHNICAVSGDDVLLKCSYSNINIKTVFWFSQKQRNNWRKNDEPEDLTLDSDYSGRAISLIISSKSLLTIKNVRERDSGEYQLMFISNSGVKHLSSLTVNLTVTALQLNVIPNSTLQSEARVKLICDSSCNLNKPYYYWYKNGLYLKYEKSNYIFVPSNRNDSYACSVYQHFQLSSSSVCLSNSNCWNVTYTSRRVCASVGSTVDIHSTYSHPTEYTVEKTYWHYIHPGGFRDLRKELKFAGRVDYVGNTLRIKVVKMSDSGEYQFRIITNTSDGRFSVSPGVILTVTDTQVISSPNPVLEGEKVILSCSTKCTLDNSYTFIWYKNGQQVTDGFTLFNKLYLDSISSEELQQYSCAVGETMSSSVFGHHTVYLLVFLPSFLIIGALWVWFYISMNKLKSKNKTDDKHKETPVQHMSVCRSAACPAEVLE